MPFRRFVTRSLAGLMTLAFLHAASAEEAYQVTAKAWEAFAQKDCDGVVRLATGLWRLGVGKRAT